MGVREQSGSEEAKEVVEGGRESEGDRVRERDEGGYVVEWRPEWEGGIPWDVVGRGQERGGFPGEGARKRDSRSGGGMGARAYVDELGGYALSVLVLFFRMNNGRFRASMPDEDRVLFGFSSGKDKTEH